MTEPCECIWYRHCQNGRMRLRRSRRRADRCLPTEAALRSALSEDELAVDFAPAPALRSTTLRLHGFDEFGDGLGLGPGFDTRVLVGVVHLDQSRAARVRGFPDPRVDRADHAATKSSFSRARSMSPVTKSEQKPSSAALTHSTPKANALRILGLSRAPATPIDRFPGSFGRQPTAAWGVVTALDQAQLAPRPLATWIQCSMNPPTTTCSHTQSSETPDGVAPTCRFMGYIGPIHPNFLHRNGSPHATSTVTPKWGVGKGPSGPLFCWRWSRWTRAA